MAESKKEKSDVARREEEILAFWEKEKIFEKSLKKEAPNGEFVFYDGPPFATGLPHYGHILPGTVKDVIPRYKTMRGYRVARRWGWDCHGLPLENLIEKELNLKTKKDIEELGIEKFNKAARDSVLRYADDWKKIIPRMGRWVDMDNDYKTMDTSYTESVWWVFKTLYDKDFIYEGFKSMHICPRCETTLSNFEVNQGYKDITDFAVTVKLELEDEPGTFLLIWTTTAWTLPGNMAAAVNREAIYAELGIRNKESGKEEHIVVAKERIKDVVGDGEYKIIKEFKGEELVGKKYKPPFDYYLKADIKGKENAWKVYHAPYVSTEDGTGTVHLAPAFGEEDMELAQKEGIPLVHHVGLNGKFTKDVKDFAGMLVKPKDDHQKIDIEIIKNLAHRGLLFKKEKVTHSYPHCWRCDTPLLNYAASSWFVKVTAIKSLLMEENKKIRWVPKEIRDGRFGKGLESAPDWAISRSRYWGAPLPVWKCAKEGCSGIEVIGSIKELREKTKNKKVSKDPDLHRPYIDEYRFSCSSCSAKDMQRIPDVFDCWFESGSVPYGEHHYPFENTDVFDPEKDIGFPADFIAESIDQTRGWFYSMLVLSVALFGKSSYKTVITNGMVLAEDGRKMSKKLQNYPDPIELLNVYGADALRYYLLSSPIIKGEDLNFSEKGVAEVMRKVIMRLSNVFSFYQLYRSPNSKFQIPNSKNVHANVEDTTSIGHQ